MTEFSSIPLSVVPPPGAPTQRGTVENKGNQSASAAWDTVGSKLWKWCTIIILIQKRYERMVSRKPGVVTSLVNDKVVNSPISKHAHS